MLDKITYSKSLFIPLVTECLQYAVSPLGIGNVARYKQESSCLPKLTFQWRKQKVHKWLYEQICKVKHTVYQIVACAMEENKREKGTREFLGYQLKGVVREGFTEKVEFFLKLCDHALLDEIIALCALFT